MRLYKTDKLNNGMQQVLREGKVNYNKRIRHRKYRVYCAESNRNATRSPDSGLLWKG